MKSAYLTYDDEVSPVSLLPRAEADLRVELARLKVERRALGSRRLTSHLNGGMSLDAQRAAAERFRLDHEIARREQRLA